MICRSKLIKPFVIKNKQHNQNKQISLVSLLENTAHSDAENTGQSEKDFTGQSEAENGGQSERDELVSLPENTGQSDAENGGQLWWILQIYCINKFFKAYC